MTDEEPTSRFRPSDVSLPDEFRRRTAARGYGFCHQQLRARLAPQVATGDVDCARCGLPILPAEARDLGHDDHDRSRWSGPEHQRCNRATSAHRRQQSVRLRVPKGCVPRYGDEGEVVGWTSRNW
jgi:hypothetical protein